MISITVDRDQDWINKSNVLNFDEAWTSVIFVPITKFTTVGEYDDYFEILATIDDREQDPSIDDPVQDLQIDEAKDKVVSDEDVTQTRVTITDYDTATDQVVIAEDVKTLGPGGPHWPFQSGPGKVTKLIV